MPSQSGIGDTQCSTRTTEDGPRRERQRLVHHCAHHNGLHAAVDAAGLEQLQRVARQHGPCTRKHHRVAAGASITTSTSTTNRDEAPAPGSATGARCHRSMLSQSRPTNVPWSMQGSHSKKLMPKPGDVKCRMYLWDASTLSQRFRLGPPPATPPAPSINNTNSGASCA